MSFLTGISWADNLTEQAREMRLTIYQLRRWAAEAGVSLDELPLLYEEKRLIQQAIREADNQRIAELLLDYEPEPGEEQPKEQQQRPGVVWRVCCECGKPAHAGGYCMTHYKRWRRYLRLEGAHGGGGSSIDRQNRAS